MKTRNQIAITLNLFIPGCGLILLRRGWMGFAISILFGVLAQIAALGLLIVPLDIPPPVAWTALLASVCVWAVSQWLVLNRRRSTNSPALDRELQTLRARARDALARADWEEAHRTLLLAMSVNDEDLENAVLWAELMGRMGKPREARRGWRRVLTLDRQKTHRAAAHQALATLHD